jgi:15-cis-phytoene synthase
MMAAADNQSTRPDYAYCEELVRRHDQDRWLASLFIPQDRRRHIHALYAFSLEIARVKDIVSEPLLGEIRFQWWRDALEGKNAGEARANPVSAALLDTIARFDLPKKLLLELIEARIRDLYGDKIESVGALDSHLDATSSNLFRLAMLILDGEAAAPGLAVSSHAGITYGLIGLMRALPWHAAQGTLFVPAEIFKAHGVEADEVAARRAPLALLSALADLRALVRRHLDIFDARLPSLPEKSKPAFLPLSLCQPYLQLMGKQGYDPFRTIVELPQWRRQWILWRAARRWG